MNRESFIKYLFSELKTLEEEDVISDKISENIKSYYKNQKLDWAKSNIFITYLSIIGSVLLWLWIILFFAANRDNISNLFKTCLILTSIITAYFTGYYLVYIKKQYLKTGYAFILLWSIFYGSGIFLIWQIYNLWGSFYQAMFLWLIWVLPLAYGIKFRPLLVLSFILFYCFIFWYLEETHYDIEWFDVTLTISSISILFLMLSNLHKWLLEKFSFWYRIVWIFGLYIAFFTFTFDDMWTSYNLWDSFPVQIIWWLLAISIALFSLFKIKFEKFDFKKDSWIIWIILVLFFYSLVYTDLIQVSYKDIWFIIFSNLLFFWMIMYLIYLWIKKKIPSYINFWTFFFIIFILAKYFDWFFEMMERSLFFIWFWVILLLSSFILERKRKKIMEEIEK